MASPAVAPVAARSPAGRASRSRRRAAGVGRPATARSTDSERLGDAGLGPDDVGQRHSLGDVTAAAAVWDFVEAHAAELDADTGYGPPFAFGPNEVADLCGPRARAVPDALRGALAEAAARGEALLVFIA